VALFRRRPLHERLLLAAPAELEPQPVLEPSIGEYLDHVGIHGVPRRREWDVVTTAFAPGVQGDSVQLVTLEGGDLVVEDGDHSGDLSPIAEAVEAKIDPPYRAAAVRQDHAIFAVGARRIRVVSLPDVEAETVVLTVQDGSRELELDGDRTFGGQAALERIGEGLGPAYVVRAERLDGLLFEFRADTL
jgi:hypothetical protein